MKSAFHQKEVSLTYGRYQLRYTLSRAQIGSECSFGLCCDETDLNGTPIAHYNNPAFTVDAATAEQIFALVVNNGVFPTQIDDVLSDTGAIFTTAPIEG